MLQRIDIKNFQAHQRLVVDLSQPITTISGPSDRGKSAILRALAWLMLNTPSGNDFVSWGSEDCRVALTVDGNEIVRKIGKGGNLYLLNKEEFRAFGAGKIPAPIADLLCVDESCFQNQEDARFWLSDTAGTVARELNSILDLQIIDESLERAAKELRTARTTADVSEARLAESKAALDKIAWSIQANTELTYIEEVSARMDAKRSQIDSLTLAIDRAVSAKELSRKAASKASELAGIVSAAKEIVAAKQQVESVENLIKQAETVKIAAERGEGARQVVLIAEKVIESINKINKLSALIDEIEKTERACQTAKENFTSAEKELRLLTKGRCPLCKSKS